MRSRPEQRERQAAAEKIHAGSKISTRRLTRGGTRSRSIGPEARTRSPGAGEIGADRGAAFTLAGGDRRHSQLVVPDPQSCVWMHAGIIAYRLCDREFDCDHCLLDAALRGDPGGMHPVTAPHHPGIESTIRDDRLYTASHLWVQSLDGAGLCRLGLDAFAAALLCNVTSVSWIPSGSLLERGDPMCRLDLGSGNVSIGAPFRGRVAGGNEALDQDPALLLGSPYDEGWLLDLAAGDPAELDGLSAPPAAHQRVRLDLWRFRRSLALRLLADENDDEPGAAQLAHHPTDLRRLLAGNHYLDLIAAFIG